MTATSVDVQTVAHADALPWGGREQWQPGDEAWFEYHCYEGLDSADAHLWLRSHQQVTVLREVDEEGFRAQFATVEERGEAGAPVLYQVRFADGAEGVVWEDELLTGPEHYTRPDPPTTEP